MRPVIAIRAYSLEMRSVRTFVDAPLVQQMTFALGSFYRMQFFRPKVLVQLDNAAVYVVQPLIGIISLLNILFPNDFLGVLGRQYWAWGAIVLLQLIFIDDIWSFAVRHGEQRRIVILWIKLLAAGVCSVLTFAGIYRQLGLVDLGQVSHSPATALYFSITAWSTVGYGDVIPTPDARAFAAAQSLIGVIYDTAVIGLVLYASTNAHSKF